MIYAYSCSMCKHEFDAHASVADRDRPQVCEYCGCGAERVFTPTAAVVVPEVFGMRRADFEQSYAACKRQEAENDRYLASKPKPKPSFETILSRELNDRGIRHPHAHQL